MPTEVEPGPAISGLVIARAAASTLIIVMPAALANVVLADQTPKPKGALNFTFLVLLVAFFVGGLVAGSEAPEQIPKHGALGAFAAFVPVQLVGILGRLDRGDPVSAFSIVILGLLAACIGTAGAQLSLKRRNRRHST